MSATTRKVSKPTAREAVYVVSVAGRDVGLLTKFRDTQGCQHPWKAYRGVGAAATFAGAFYPADGGRTAALVAAAR